MLLPLKTLGVNVLEASIVHALEKPKSFWNKRKSMDSSNAKLPKLLEGGNRRVEQREAVANRLILDIYWKEQTLKDIDRWVYQIVQDRFQDLLQVIGSIEGERKILGTTCVDVKKVQGHGKERFSHS